MAHLYAKISCGLFLFVSFFSFSSLQAQSARSVTRMINDYNKGRQDGKKMKGYLAYEVGLILPRATRTYTHAFPNFDQNGNFNGDSTTVEKTIKSNVFGGYAGTYFRLAPLSAKSCLAVSTGVSGYFINHQLGEIETSANSRYDYPVLYLEMGIPVFLDFKYGGEAVFDKADKFSFTFGAGLYGALGVTSLGDAYSSTKVFLSPSIKAELGFFTGIQWKLKAWYISNPKVNLDQNVTERGGYAPVGSQLTYTTSSVFNLGITLMPFSFGWENSKW